ncbi:MAG: P-II family nitrogen regulator [Candidatus Marinimicrobia bacterium]|jgi:nitrogen regulatory protein P-II 1|nr:P-II family nitrogen regulator [Candidatus Neomarinimicrobiota bacterium]MBT3675160.1 P-II family nitrogen regulator [Candidatus Neomarinimicrobiota bacterium]MBT3763870.1 P-II family nitrogen regulator [Candidatus Neomarinimicrobiota bacterium]MBT4067999.1 P-II family nitrogen regulator [Candidatus Neomarinimicrobiota bacterium]MBT4271232.1 P-II family nitrogen regulator [Candidatus Neomarinimicrobiota bacterium]
MAALINNGFVENVIEAISSVAYKEGDKGRGKIFIMPIEECIRIRTGEKGSTAIG